MACGSLRKKGLLEDGSVRAAWDGPADLSYSACPRLCGLFVFCGPSFKTLSTTLSAWGYPV